MCLGFPGRVERIDELTADVDIAGTKRNVSRIFIAEELNIGDWVMVHAGFAMSKMDEKEAKETLDFLLSVANDEEALEEEFYKNLDNKTNQDLDSNHNHENHNSNSNAHKCGCHKEDGDDGHSSNHNHGSGHGGDKKGCCGGGGCGSH